MFAELITVIKYQMNKLLLSKLNIIKIVLWTTIFFSTLALIYHTRWLGVFLVDKTHYVVPHSQSPFLWFIIQICCNLIFIYVGYILIKLCNKYKQTGFFDEGSLDTFNQIIYSCLVLALLGAIQSIGNNLSEVHFTEWNSIDSIANLSFRTFTKLLVIESPQTMYLLLAIILWTVRQFISTALLVKIENESFV